LSDGEEYELVLTPPARRALTDVLPEADRVRDESPEVIVLRI